MTDRPDLDALEAAHAKATQKRWTGGYEAIHTQTDRNHPWASTVFSANHDGAEADALLTMTFGKTPEHATANAAAIVALHNAFPALAAYTRALEAEVAALRRGLPLLKAIAAWESMNGTVAAIMPSEHSSLCQLISEAAVEGSARAALDASGDA